MRFKGTHPPIIGGGDGFRMRPVSNAPFFPRLERNKEMLVQVIGPWTPRVFQGCALRLHYIVIIDGLCSMEWKQILS